MKKVLNLIVGLSCLSITTAVSAQEVEIKIGHALSEHSSYQVAAEHFAKTLQEKAKGKVSVKIFPSGTLGGELKLVQGLRTGVVDAAIIGQPSLENTVREYKVLSLPYLFDGYHEANEIMQGKVGSQLLTVLDKYGMKGIGWGAIYARSIAATKPINSIDDMHRLKVRVIQSPGYVAAYQALGAQSTPTAYGELFMALQNGVVDAAELSPDQTVGDGFVEIIKSFSVTEVHQLPSIFIFSKAKFQRYPKDIQDLIESAGKEAVKVAVNYQNEQMVRAIDVMKQKGVKVVTPDLTPFKEKARASWDSIVKTAPDGESIVREIRDIQQQGK